MRWLAVALLTACSSRASTHDRVAPHHIVLGIDSDPRTSISIRWKSTLPSAYVRYGLASDQLTRLAVDTGGHRVRLTGLAPGTFYSYQIVVGNETSPVYEFHTARDTPDSETVIGVLGDPCGRYDLWQQLTSELEKRSPDLVIATGELADSDLLATVPVVSAETDYGFAHLGLTPHGEQWAVTVRRASSCAAEWMPIIDVRSVQPIRVDRGAVAVDPAAPSTSITAAIRMEDTAALVRVRRGLLAVEGFGAGGTRVPATFASR